MRFSRIFLCTSDKFRCILVSRKQKGNNMSHLEIIQVVSDATPAEASAIYHQMQCNGFDFSEATMPQYRDGVTDARIDMGLQEVSDEDLERLYRSL